MPLPANASAPHARLARRHVIGAGTVIPLLALLAWTLGARPSARGEPRFTRAAGAPATDRASTGGVTWVDYDADGDLDLFVTNGYTVSAPPPPVPQPDRLYRNDGGTLTPVPGGPLATDSAFSSGSTWADYDNDGDLDAFVSTQLNQPDLLYRNEGRGRFTAVRDGDIVNTPGSSFASSWVDVDNDGWVDLFVSNGGLSGPQKSFLFRNARDGKFARVTDAPMVTDSVASGGPSWADYDNDGDQDLFVPRLISRTVLAGGALYRNDGNWRFTAVTGDAVVTDTVPAISAAWGDMDDDGDLDLAVGALGGRASRLYRNTGKGTFERITEGDFVTAPSAAYTVNWADVDNDGDLDLLQGNWGAASYLFLNRGDGTLVRTVVGDLGRTIGYASSATWGDVDGDGDLDAYVGNWPQFAGEGEENQFYRNTGSNGNWLLIRLVGTASNRAALGARVTVRASIGGRPRTQIREVAAHTGWRSQNALEQHVGLGDAARADEIVVRWPSGRVDRVAAVRANQRVTITEGQGRAAPVGRSTRPGG